MLLSLCETCGVGLRRASPGGSNFCLAICGVMLLDESFRKSAQRGRGRGVCFLCGE